MTLAFQDMAETSVSAADVQNHAIFWPDLPQQVLVDIPGVAQDCVFAVAQGSSPFP
jgi:hypothetical protein